ncbi:MAG: DUF262 domain-containing protein [Planctomycetes bacterium]|nr:DUF262 domain-containing protein [Planctomycetota bacterium]
MQTELYSLSKIFTENLFRIPDYQRGYSWGPTQLKHFWSDIVLLDSGRDHYTGVLTLEEVDAETTTKWTDDLWIITSKRYRPYYVVDGQQRLTTSLILLQCIIEKAGQNGELNYSTVAEIRKKYIFESRDKGISRSHIFGYERDNPSYEYLKTRIFNDSSDDHSTGEETIYTHNLIAAKSFFKDQLSQYQADQLESIYTTLTQHLLFNIYVISKDIDVFVAFETMNNRGKPLSYLELLKNRLIFLSTRLGVDDVERSKLRRVINESWKTAYHFLGRNRERPLNDDHFLDVQFVLYIGTQPQAANTPDKPPRDLWRYRRHRDDLRVHLLESYFTSRNVFEAGDHSDGSGKLLTAKSLYGYAHDLKRCVETYYRLFNPEDSEYSDDVRIHLARIGRLGWRDTLPLAVASIHQRPESSDIELLLANLERFLFVLSLRFQYEDEDLDAIALGVQVAKNSESVRAAAEKIHSITEKRVAKLEMAETAVTLSRTQYYGWRPLAYLLFEYEQELKKRSRSNRDKIVWKEFCREDFETDYSTIEHIYPQKPRDQYWKDRFGSLTVKQRNALRNSLGNFLPLSRPKNAALGNRPFPAKRDGSAESGGYRVGSYSEIEVSNCEEWTPQAIVDRGVRLLEFAERRWQLQLGDRSKKIAALGLRFIEDSSAEVDGVSDPTDEPEQS